MRKLFIFLLMTTMIVLSACSKERSDQFVLVKGGIFVNTKSNYYEKNVTISDFYMGKYEVTQKEWMEVMGNNPSEFKGDNLPVEMVSWYDSIEYCNQRSIKEGLEPYYYIDKTKKDQDNKNENDDKRWAITINEGANGYRLPTEAEWEYAAGGGQKSKSYKYSGSNEVDDVAWYYKNSGDKYLSGDWFWPTIENNRNRTKYIGLKKPNELGLYDMSGNIREWCWDWFEDANIDSGYVRVWRGGGWLGDSRGAENSYRGNHEAYSIGFDQGLRVCRNK